MTQEQIMQLVDALCVEYNNTMVPEFKTAVIEARAAVVAELEQLTKDAARIRELWGEDQIESSEQRTQIHQLRAQVDALTKDAERYRIGREAEYAGLMPTFRAGRTWAEAMDSAYDAAIAASNEQIK